MTPNATAEPTPPRPPGRRVFLHAFAVRHPFVYWFLLLLVSNAAASIFNIVYNFQLIVGAVMDDEQRWVFRQVALPLYNAIAYPICLGLIVVLVLPLASCWRRLKRGEPVPADELEFCRRRLVNLPFLQIIINLLGWLPGAIFFPALVCGLGGAHHEGEIWKRFAISFVVSAIYATAQTFFLMESFLVRILYPEFLRGARAADVKGVIIIPFGWRIFGLWLAIGAMPLVALFVVAFHFPAEHHAILRWLTMLIAVSGMASGMVIFWMVKVDMEHWIRTHAAATEEVARENFAVRILEQRPDEWGRLSDSFNDMAVALGRAQHMHQTFGQFVSPQVRDQILDRYPGLQVSLQTITVLFVDIRGFTRRCAGEAPQRVGDLLNRFFNLAVDAVEGNGGYVNKFLGDGVLALFGATQPDARHADRAVHCARELVTRLVPLNEELSREGIEPLEIGIGIHTGPALVGCFGAMLPLRGGQPQMRREFSAIGETVNLGQRIEQMTKRLGGPILLSAATRDGLKDENNLVDLGPQPLPGAPEPVRLFRVP